MIFFLLLLDAIGGLLLALFIFSIIRLKKFLEYKFKFKGVISKSLIKGEKMEYTVVFTVDGKEQSRSYSMRLPSSDKGQFSAVNKFLSGYSKGNSFTLMCKSADATTEVIPSDNPKVLVIVTTLLLVIFHASAFLTKGSLFFALGA